MKKLATTAAAVARRSCARMSHIRGVKLERRVIVPLLPPTARSGAINTGLSPHALPPRARGRAGENQSIAAFLTANRSDAPSATAWACRTCARSGVCGNAGRLLGERACPEFGHVGVGPAAARLPAHRRGQHQSDLSG